MYRNHGTKSLSTMPVAESLSSVAASHSTFCIRVGQRCEPGHGCHGACRRTAPKKTCFTASQLGKPNSVPHEEKRCNLKPHDHGILLIPLEPGWEKKHLVIPRAAGNQSSLSSESG